MPQLDDRNNPSLRAHDGQGKCKKSKKIPVALYFHRFCYVRFHRGSNKMTNFQMAEAYVNKSTYTRKKKKQISE